MDAVADHDASPAARDVPLEPRRGRRASTPNRCIDERSLTSARPAPAAERVDVVGACATVTRRGGPARPGVPAPAVGRRGVSTSGRTPGGSPASSCTVPTASVGGSSPPGGRRARRRRSGERAAAEPVAVALDHGHDGRSYARGHPLDVGPPRCRVDREPQRHGVDVRTPPPAASLAVGHAVSAGSSGSTCAWRSTPATRRRRRRGRRAVGPDRRRSAPAASDGDDDPAGPARTEGAEADDRATTSGAPPSASDPPGSRWPAAAAGSTRPPARP